MPPVLMVVGASESGFAQVLSRAGYKVVEADSGEKALELAPSVLPEVILMAIVMPQLNGLQTAVELRRLPGSRTTSIILLGSIPPIGIDQEPLTSLIDGYLSMNASARDVLACVSSRCS
jgi:CheY-like chemotaxis protein